MANKECGPRKYVSALVNVITPFTLAGGASVVIPANKDRMTLIVGNNGPDILQSFPAGFDLAGPPMCTMGTEMYELEFDKWGPMVAGQWTFIAGSLGANGGIVETNWLPNAKV